MKVDPTVIAALIISLVALLVSTTLAIAQLCQGIFATADGYRRCQSPVMGEWANFTKRKFKWREFRFDTIFLVPVIFLYDNELVKNDQDFQKGSRVENGSVKNAQDFQKEGRVDKLQAKKVNCPIKDRAFVRIIGTPESYKATMLSDRIKEDALQWTLQQPSDGNHRTQIRENHTQGDGPQRSDGNQIVDVECGSSRNPAQRGSNLAQSHSRGGQKKNPSSEQKPSDLKIDNEAASWIHCLQALQKCQKFQFEHTREGFTRGMVIAVQESRRSWDFVPQDVIRPFAVSNVGDVATIFQHLGMRWTEFSPGKGLMRAEGNNSLVTSTWVRSLGMILMFSTDTENITNEERCRNVYVPSLEASLLGFGLVPRREEIAPLKTIGRTPKNAFHVGDVELFDRCLKSFCGYNRPVGQNGKSLVRSNSFSVASESVSLLAPVLRMRNSTITRILRPAANIGHDVASTQFFLQPFRDRLVKHMDTHKVTSDRLQSVLQQCNSILDHPGWSKQHHHPEKYDCNHADITLLDIIHDAWDESTTAFLAYEGQYKTFLESHLKCLFQLADGQEDLAGNSEHVGKKIMSFYFKEYLPTATAHVKKVHSLPDKEITLNTLTGLWATMIFRSLCWYNLHCFKYKFAILEFQYFGSKMPVYIG